MVSFSWICIAIAKALSAVDSCSMKLPAVRVNDWRKQQRSTWVCQLSATWSLHSLMERVHTFHTVTLNSPDFYKVCVCFLSCCTKCLRNFLRLFWRSYYTFMYPTLTWNPLFVHTFTRNSNKNGIPNLIINYTKYIPVYTIYQLYLHNSVEEIRLFTIA